MRDAYEKAQIPAMHTFSRLPGYFPRPREEEAIRKILTGIPSFTVLFGASRSLPRPVPRPVSPAFPPAFVNVFTVYMLTIAWEKPPCCVKC